MVQLQIASYFFSNPFFNNLSFLYVASKLLAFSFGSNGIWNMIADSIRTVRLSGACGCWWWRQFDDPLRFKSKPDRPFSLASHTIQPWNSNIINRIDCEYFRQHLLSINGTEIQTDNQFSSFLGRSYKGPFCKRLQGLAPSPPWFALVYISGAPPSPPTCKRSFWTSPTGQR